MNRLHEDRASVWSQMEELVKAGADSWDAETTQKYERMESDYRSLTSKIEAEERFAKLAEPQGSPVTVTDTTADADAYSAAFDMYLRHGVDRMDSEQRSILLASEARTMSTTTDSQGGFLVPETLRNSLIESLVSFGGLRAHAEVLTTDSGQDLILPANDDTANEGEIVSQNTEVADQDLSFTAVTIGVNIYSSKAVRVPVSLLEDSGVALDPYIGRKLGERIARLQATHWLWGTNINQPQGLIYGRDQSKDLNTTAAFTYDNLVDLTRKVDPAYRALPGTAFLMNDSTAGKVRKLKGTANDHPLWEPSMQVSDPDRILGYPVIIDQGMDDDAVSGQATPNSGTPIAFGNFREAYIVRDVKGVSVLRLAELYARFHQVGFIGFLRSDGGVKNTAAYACLERTS